MTNLPALETARADLAAKLDNIEAYPIGSPERRKIVVAHRLLTDLIERGDTPDERRVAYVMQKINE